MIIKLKFKALSKFVECKQQNVHYLFEKTNNQLSKKNIKVLISITPLRKK